MFAANDGQRWYVSVRDRGIGSDPTDADRIFQAFDRSHSREEYARTGIGLAIRRRVVERRDGAITVDGDGEPGEGATVAVTHPSSASVREPPAESERDATSEDGDANE